MIANFNRMYNLKLALLSKIINVENLPFNPVALFTDHVRSRREGNVFTGACHSILG